MSVPPSTPDEDRSSAIGELSRRTGVGVDTLRAWERRYGLLRAARSPGGFRLYGTSDQERVRRNEGADRLGRLRRRGRAAGGVARIPGARNPASGRGPEVAGPRRAAGRRPRPLRRGRTPTRSSTMRSRASPSTPSRAASCCRSARDRRRAGRAERSQSPRSTSPPHSCAGECCSRPQLGCRGRPACAARLSARRTARPRPDRLRPGPSGRGWRIAFLGSDTPIETIADAVARLAPEAVVLAAVTTREPFESVARQISGLAAAFGC